MDGLIFFVMEMKRKTKKSRHEGMKEMIEENRKKGDSKKRGEKNQVVFPAPSANVSMEILPSIKTAKLNHLDHDS